MALFDILGSDGPPPPWGRLAAAFMGGVHVAVGGGREVVDQLGHWGSLLAQNAVRSWSPYAELPRFCSHQGCDAQGIVPCAVCKRLSCMAHCLVNHYAEGVCETCMLRLMRAASAPPKPDKSKLIAAAFRALGLEQGASWERIHAEYRQLAVKHHPDRAKTASAKKKAEARMRRINDAYAVLRDHVGPSSKEAA